MWYFTFTLTCVQVSLLCGYQIGESLSGDLQENHYISQYGNCSVNQWNIYSARASFSKPGLKPTLYFLSEGEGEAARTAGNGRVQKCFLWMSYSVQRGAELISTLLSKRMNVSLGWPKFPSPGKAMVIHNSPESRGTRSDFKSWSEWRVRWSLNRKYHENYDLFIISCNPSSINTWRFVIYPL